MQYHQQLRCLLFEKNYPKTCLVRKKINFLFSLFSRDSLCRKPRRRVFSRRGLCCLLDSSRTNTSSATDNYIKNIYNEEDIFTGIAVFDKENGHQQDNSWYFYIFTENALKRLHKFTIYIVFVTMAHRARERWGL